MIRTVGRPTRKLVCLRSVAGGEAVCAVAVHLNHQIDILMEQRGLRDCVMSFDRRSAPRHADRREYGEIVVLGQAEVVGEAVDEMPRIVVRIRRDGELPEVASEGFGDLLLLYSGKRHSPSSVS